MKEKQKTQITGRLEDWVYDDFTHMVYGHIYGDKRERFKDGLWVHTSRLCMHPDKLKKGGLCKTLNSLYKLGEPRKGTWNVSNF